MVNLLGKIKPASFFVVVAVFFELLYLCTTPPFQAPDDLNHFYRAYQVSEGYFLPVQEDKRLGGSMPVGLKEFMLPFSHTTFMQKLKTGFPEIAEGFKVELSPENREFCDFPNTSYYSLVSYLPQACAIWLLRQFNCSVGTIYYGGKLLVYLTWLLAMYYVIKNMPLGKWLFVVLFLLPMQLYISNTYSADIVTNVLAFTLISLILKHVFLEEKIPLKILVFIVILAGLLALAKVIYVGVLLLLVLLPASRFASMRGKVFFLGIVYLLAFTLAAYWSGVYNRVYLSYNDYNVYYRIFATHAPASDYHLQKQHLMEHPAHFLKVVYNGLFHNPQFYLLSYVAHFGTYLDLPTPTWLYKCALATILVTAFFEKNQVSFSIKQKLIVFAAGFGTYLLLLFSHHLTWNTVAAETIDSIQGRYLVPILPLIFILFSNGWQRFKFHSSLQVVLVGGLILFFNFYCVNVLYERYIKDSCLQKTEFYCDFETDEKNNSPSLIPLEGVKTGKQHYAGKKSLVLSPDKPEALIYRFAAFKPGDVLSIEAWQKGEGGKFEISGIGKDSCRFNFGNETVYFKKNGWKKMNMTFEMGDKCDSNLVSFKLLSPGTDTVYFDDLHFILRRF